MTFVGSVDGELRAVADNLDTLKHAHTGIADNIGFERMLSLVLKIGTTLFVFLLCGLVTECNCALLTWSMSALAQLE